jgi:hypothetical protein
MFGKLIQIDHNQSNIYGIILMFSFLKNIILKFFFKKKLDLNIFCSARNIEHGK